MSVPRTHTRTSQSMISRRSLILSFGTASALCTHAATGASFDFVHVCDVVQACLAAALRPQPGYLVADIATGQEWSAREVVETVADVVGRPIQTYSSAAMTRGWERTRWKADLWPARNRLGWAPAIDLRAGIARLAADRQGCDAG